MSDLSDFCWALAADVARSHTRADLLRLRRNLREWLGAADDAQLAVLLRGLTEEATRRGLPGWRALGQAVAELEDRDAAAPGRETPGPSTTTGER